MDPISRTHPSCAHPQMATQKRRLLFANATSAIATYDRYCPWCWTNPQLPANPTNMTRQGNLIVQRPVDANSPLSEYIDGAVLSHDFKKLRGIQLRVPWDVPTNFTIGLVEPYKNGTGRVAVLKSTTTVTATSSNSGIRVGRARYATSILTIDTLSTMLCFCVCLRSRSGYWCT